MAKEVYTYAVGCIVVIGITPTMAPAQKSFELYRNNLRGVTVITFDELLDKLKALYQFLAEPPPVDEPDVDEVGGFDYGEDDDLDDDEGDDE